METRWLYNTPETLLTLREESKNTCIIPMGCVEKHGLHMPLGTDIIHASHLAYMASQLEPVCIFPDFIFGDVPEGDPNMPMGSITLPLETEMLLLEQLCEQIVRHGFKKIAVLNGHGGNNSWLNTFMRYLTSKKRDFVLVVINLKLSAPHTLAENIIEHGAEYYPELTGEDVELLLKQHEANMKIGHAGLGESSYIMGICPEAMHLDRLGIESGANLEKTKYLKEAGISIRDGGWGINFPNAFSADDPIGVNERIGKAALRTEAERLAYAFKVLKEDENLLKWHEERQKGW